MSTKHLLDFFIASVFVRWTQSLLMISCAVTVSSQSLPARFQQSRSVCSEEEWACSEITQTQTAAEMSVSEQQFLPLISLSGLETRFYLSSESVCLTTVRLYDDHVRIMNR